METGPLEQLQEYIELIEGEGYKNTAMQLLLQAIANKKSLLLRLQQAYEEQQHLIERYEELSGRNMDLRRTVRELQETLEGRT